MQFSSNMRIVSQSGNVKVTHVGAAAPPGPQEEQDTRSFDEGFQAGVEQTRREAEPILAAQQAQIQELQEQISHLQHEIPQAINQYLHELEQQAREEATELAFVAAEAIVHREVDRDNGIRETLLQALQHLTHLNEVKLMVSPADYQLLTTGSDGVPPGIQLIQDAQLVAGELYLESPQGFLDGKIHTRLAELRTQFMQILNRTESDDVEDA